MKKITKAVIAAAGYGTRFLPATKNQPKEMLPIIDKPIIHYLVEEAVKSGITDIVLVTRSGQNSLEDYFDSHRELENELQKAGKTEKLRAIKKIPKMANFIYMRQKADLPYGNATPLISAASVINPDEPFVYMFGDDLTISSKPVVKQLIEVYKKEKPKAVLAVQEVPKKEVHKYGIVRYKKKQQDNSYEIDEACEKLPAEKAPSRMAVLGRFVFSYDIIKEALKTPTGKDNELWVTDILNNFAREGEKIIAQPIEGEWYTTGDPLNYLKTSYRFAMERDDIKNELKKYLREFL
jgi:UTP--glucose-1-phosphate uridylyltransferase